jgi:hypothetical protein
MDLVFQSADHVGVGSEVRTIVYGVRTYEYASSMIAPYIPPAAAAAAGQVLANVGGVATLGAVGIAVGIVAAIFGGGDSDEDIAKRQKQAQSWADKLTARLDLQGFASEQDDVAGFYQGQLDRAGKGGIPEAAMPGDVQGRNTAQKLATFYRACDAQLSADDKALFVSLSNVGRWDGATAAFQTSSSPEFLALIPNVLSQLSDNLDTERSRLGALIASRQGGAALAANQAIGPVLLFGVGAAAALWYFAPALVLGALGQAMRLGTSVLGQVRRIF